MVNLRRARSSVPALSECTIARYGCHLMPLAFRSIPPSDWSERAGCEGHAFARAKLNTMGGCSESEAADSDSPSFTP